MPTFNLSPPKLLGANLRYRAHLKTWALARPANARYLLDRCQKDILFFMDSFAWCIEPRPEPGLPALRPLISWPSQRVLFEALQTHGGHCDVVVVKSRGEGASWAVLWEIVRRFVLFEDDPQALGLISRTLDLADSASDPSSLGQKVDFALSQLPVWLLGGRVGRAYADGCAIVRNLSRHTWNRKLRSNPGLESSITAYAPGPDLLAGARLTMTLIDELARFRSGSGDLAMSASEAATNSRIVVSTVSGDNNAFYRCLSELSAAVMVTMDWKNNPTRNADLFTIDYTHHKLRDSVTGQPLTTDYAKDFFITSYPVLVRRGYPVTDKKKIWSPWYVSRALRPRMSPRSMAAEYDMSVEGTSQRFFDESLINELLKTTRKAVTTVHPVLKYDTMQPAIDKLEVVPEGELRMWTRLIRKGLPVPGKYAFGIDVASGRGGTYSSNSVISIGDAALGSKIGEFVSPTITPENLADMAVALAQYFVDEKGHPAYIVVEANGPGGAFVDRMIELNFGNYYRSLPRTKLGGKRAKVPGWVSSNQSKFELLSRYRFALAEGNFSNPSEIALRETLQYQHQSGDKIVFLPAVGLDKDNYAAHGKNHGDRVIADALCNLGIEEMNGGKPPAASFIAAPVIKPPRFPAGSYGARQKGRQREEKQRLLPQWSARRKPLDV